MNIFRKALDFFSKEPKTPKKDQPKYRYRSAITGKTMSKEEFDRTPKENTVRERIK